MDEPSSQVLEILKKLEPYFSELEKRIDGLEQRIKNLEDKEKTSK